MFALLPALLLLWMQGAAPSEVLDPRVRAELLVSMKGSGMAAACAGLMAAVHAAPSVSGAVPAARDEAPASLLAPCGEASSLEAPLLAGDRSRDGPQG